jgi:hypothetical protein
MIINIKFFMFIFCIHSISKYLINNFNLNMGQLLPLPERIPRPTPNQINELKNLGIEVNIEEKDEKGNPCMYVQYTLPVGWKMVDKSWREDLPDYYIVDIESKARVSISGSWKGSYDNKLRLSILKNPIILKPDEGKLIPSETSNYAMLGKFAEALDPLGRPAEPLSADRKPDFIPHKI